MTSEAEVSAAIRKGVVSAVAKVAPSIVDKCLNALWDHPWFPFIAGGQMRLIEAGMKPRAAWALSRQVLTHYARNDKLTFGDPAFDWSPAGGRSVIEECEIAYWEDAS